MTYPAKYARQYDFQSYQNANPTRPLPGDKVNVDLDYVASTIDQVVEFQKLIQRSDGAVANASVGLDSLSDEAKLALTGSGVDVVLLSNIPQNAQSADYTLVLADSARHIFHPAADTTARTWTIPGDETVDFPIGTAVSFVNHDGGGDITISLESGTLYFAGTNLTGSRTLEGNAMATALKITSTAWMISGTTGLV